MSGGVGDLIGCNMAYPLVVSLIAAALVLILLSSRRWSRHRRRLPPGPKPLPLLGNLLDIPKEQPWVKYKEWAKQYGEWFPHFGPLTRLLTMESRGHPWPSPTRESTVRDLAFSASSSRPPRQAFIYVL